MRRALRQTLAVARKDLRSELRSRYALNALGMFVIVTVAVMGFSAAGEELSSGVASGLIWVSMFFTAVTGLGRSFISEEERGTYLLLRLALPAAPVYFGKLLINVLLALLSNLLLSLFFLVMMSDVQVKSPVSFVTVVLASSLGFAASLTIIAALIARAGSKGALYPVLGFPVILPQIILGADLLRRSMLGIPVAGLADDLLLLLLYTVSLVLLSYLLFDLIWKE